jgi:hypothetical protein
MSLARNFLRVVNTREKVLELNPGLKEAAAYLRLLKKEEK